ncbi:MAG: hypothetical protein JWN08_3518 [Frankiales bacterium]|nr:hypothetical protein [Frankiales bacterium]
MAVIEDPVTEQVPVAEDLFRVTADGAALVGTRCTGCGTHYFPKSLSCRNPRCEAKAVEQVDLGRSGRLYSYTVQAYRPPALFRTDSWAPYAIGLVELPEGLRVLAMLVGSELSDLRIEMPLELAVHVLYRDDQGRDVVTYAYAPPAGGGAS